MLKVVQKLNVSKEVDNRILELAQNIVNHSKECYASSAEAEAEGALRKTAEAELTSEVNSLIKQAFKLGKQS